MKRRGICIINRMHVAQKFEGLLEMYRRPDGRRWSGQEIDEGAFSEAARECAKKMCRLADAPADSGAYSAVVHRTTEAVSSAFPLCLSKEGIDGMRRPILLLLLGAMLAAPIVVSAAAWAATTIRCPNDPQGIGGGTCWGTRGADVIIGTSQKDEINGDRGADLILAGGGADLITNGESDYWFGEDKNHGGRGADYIVGQVDSEKHFGGRGDDRIVDYKSGKNPDVIRCGAGRDEVTYNKELDRVADDCEVLRPVSKGMVTPN